MNVTEWKQWYGIFMMKGYRAEREGEGDFFHVSLYMCVLQYVCVCICVFFCNKKYFMKVHDVFILPCSPIWSSLKWNGMLKHWWYHSLTAHQHQKGHTVPKPVIMIAKSIQTLQSKNCTVWEHSLSGQVWAKCPTRPDTRGAPRGGCSHAPRNVKKKTL